MSEIRLRRVTLADMKAFGGEFLPELYVKWDGMGPAERLRWVATCLFDSGRRVFHLDDNGNILLVDAEGNSVLGTSELYVPQEKLFVILYKRRGEWTVWHPGDGQAVLKRREAEGCLKEVQGAYPALEARIAEVLV